MKCGEWNQVDFQRKIQIVSAQLLVFHEKLLVFGEVSVSADNENLPENNYTHYLLTFGTQNEASSD